MTVHGVDVASYQATDFATSGQDFAFVKATQGTGYVNPRYVAQVAHARAAGLIVGHYHYGDGGSVAAELAHFLDTIAPQLKAGDLLAFDWEETAVSCAEKDNWIKGAQAKQPAHRVLLYCNRNFWLDRDATSFCGDGLWIADPSSTAGHPAVQHAWTLHQYSSSGGIDHNVANFPSKAALAAWAAKTTTPSPQEDDDMPLTDADAQKLAHAVAYYDTVPAIPAGDPTANADAKTNTTWTTRYAWGAAVAAARNAERAAEQCVAQLASVAAVLTAIQKNGGLTAEEAVAAGKAGAQAALAELGDRLQSPSEDAS